LSIENVSVSTEYYEEDEGVSIQHEHDGSPHQSPPRQTQKNDGIISSAWGAHSVVNFEFSFIFNFYITSTQHMYAWLQEQWRLE